MLFIGILKCFASWISIQAFDDQLLLSSPLLINILDILVNPFEVSLNHRLLFV